MPPRKLPRHLVWLESFAAAVESGSLEGAAEHLGVARSVVSEHIRALGGRPLRVASPSSSAAPAAASTSPPAARSSTRAPRPPSTSWTSSGCRDLASAEASLRLGLNPTLSNFLLAGIAGGRRPRRHQAGGELRRHLRARAPGADTPVGPGRGLHPAAAPPRCGGRVPAPPALRRPRRPGQRAVPSAMAPAARSTCGPGGPALRGLAARGPVRRRQQRPLRRPWSHRARGVARAELPPPLRLAARLPRLRHRPRPAAVALLPRRTSASGPCARSSPSSSRW